MILTWLTGDELREIGWSEDHIHSGLVAHVDLIRHTINGRARVLVYNHHSHYDIR